MVVTELMPSGSPNLDPGADAVSVQTAVGRTAKGEGAAAGTYT